MDQGRHSFCCLPSIIRFIVSFRELEAVHLLADFSGEKGEDVEET